MKEIKTQDIRLKTESPTLYSRMESYSPDAIYTEPNINQVSIKYLNFTPDKEFAVSYADFRTSGLITGSREEWTPAGAHPQKHEGFEFLYLLKGQMTEEIRGVSYAFRAGDAILMSPDCPSLFLPSLDSIIFSLTISRKYLEQFYISSHQLHMFPPQVRDLFLENRTDSAEGRSRMDFLWFRCTDPAACDAFAEAARGTYDELRKRQNGFEFILAGMLIRLFYFITDDSSYTITKSERLRYSGRELAESICDYLQAHKKKITADELSLEFHFNKSYLEKDFKARMGVSLKKYNEAIYMREAEYLLTHSGQSISQVAEAVGFKSRSQFYKAYEAYFGVKP